MAGSCSYDAFLSKRWWRMRRIGLFTWRIFLGEGSKVGRRWIGLARRLVTKIANIRDMIMLKL